MREDLVVTQPAWTDLRPRCEDCHTITEVRTTILDPREGRQISVYQCSNCSRLVWRD
ncbi:formate dehydrogenase maturation protein FdhE [Bradyrhizobium diazoefficiens]